MNFSCTLIGIGFEMVYSIGNGSRFGLGGIAHKYASPYDRHTVAFTWVRVRCTCYDATKPDLGPMYAKNEPWPWSDAYQTFPRELPPVFHLSYLSDYSLALPCSSCIRAVGFVSL